MSQLKELNEMLGSHATGGHRLIRFMSINFVIIFNWKSASSSNFMKSKI